jgi:hypothetical protein
LSLGRNEARALRVVRTAANESSMPPSLKS